MLVLRLPDARLRKELEVARRVRALDPNGWPGLAGVGKVLRFAGDRGGLDLLAEAGEACSRTLRTRRPGQLMTAANLFRLAGDAARSEELFREVRDGRADTPDAVADLVEAHVLLGEDHAALSLDERSAGAARRPGLRQAAVLELAAARLEQDATRIEGVVDWFDRALQAERESPADSGHINLHDWLEFALVVQSQLSGAVSPRLREM